MGFLDSFNDAANSAAEKVLNAYKQKLRRASDSQVQAKWDEVCNDYNLDERFREATEDEMRRRGLL